MRWLVRTLDTLVNSSQTQGVGMSPTSASLGEGPLTSRGVPGDMDGVLDTAVSASMGAPPRTGWPPMSIGDDIHPRGQPGTSSSARAGTGAGVAGDGYGAASQSMNSSYSADRYAY